MAVADLVLSALKGAEATSQADYLAMAKALLAWLAWREARCVDVAAGAAWDSGDQKLAEAKLVQAVELAEQLRYL